MDERSDLLFRKPEEIRDRLEFPKAVLTLLKDTELFGPAVERALKDVDFLIQKADRWR